MSRSVRTLASTCSLVPPGTVATRFHPLKESVWPLGENALSCEILRWLFHCCLTNTVAFLPLVLHQGTHRNAIQFSRCWREYGMLTDMCQAGMLLAWRRNQKTPPCGLPRKIWQRLPVLGTSMLVSPIRQRYGWLCKLSHDKSNLHPSPLPQGRAIHPPLGKQGLSGSLTVTVTLLRCFLPGTPEYAVIMGSPASCVRPGLLQSPNVHLPPEAPGILPLLRVPHRR
jgi:hypothetical protein